MPFPAHIHCTPPVSTTLQRVCGQLISKLLTNGAFMSSRIFMSAWPKVSVRKIRTSLTIGDYDTLPTCTSQSLGLGGDDLGNPEGRQWVEGDSQVDETHGSLPDMKVVKHKERGKIAQIHRTNATPDKSASTLIKYINYNPTTLIESSKGTSGVSVASTFLVTKRDTLDIVSNNWIARKMRQRRIKSHSA